MRVEKNSPLSQYRKGRKFAENCRDQAIRSSDPIKFLTDALGSDHFYRLEAYQRADVKLENAACLEHLDFVADQLTDAIGSNLFPQGEGNGTALRVTEYEVETEHGFPIIPNLDLEVDVTCHPHDGSPPTVMYTESVTCELVKADGNTAIYLCEIS